MPRPFVPSDRFVYTISYRDSAKYLQDIHFSFDEMKAMEWCMNRTGDNERYSAEPLWRFIIRKNLADDPNYEYSKIVCIFNQAGNTVDVEDSGEGAPEYWMERVDP